MKINWMSSVPAFSSAIQVFAGANTMPPGVDIVVLTGKSHARIAALQNDDLILVKMSVLWDCATRRNRLGTQYQMLGSGALGRNLQDEFDWLIRHACTWQPDALFTLAFFQYQNLWAKRLSVGDRCRQAEYCDSIFHGSRVYSREKYGSTVRRSSVRR